MCGFSIHKRIILFDSRGILSDEIILEIKNKYRYELIYYDDIEKFRNKYEKEIKKKDKRYLVVIKYDTYLPYDIRENFHCQKIEYSILFSKLNPYALEKAFLLDINLLFIAHENLYRSSQTEEETKKFLSEDIYYFENVKEYSEYLINEIKILLEDDNHKSWIGISLMYAKLEYIRYKSKNDFYDENFINEIQMKFKNFILTKYSGLSSLSSYHSPVLLNKTMSYIFRNSKKPAIIVMDGMSIRDWLIISEELKDIKYKYNSTYAIIPTITSISRQSLLSSRLPIEINKPFSLTDERSMFIDNSKENGYLEEEIQYYRGYDFEVGYRDKCICVIINDIDDLVHSQKQGNAGMYNDIKLLSQSGKIYNLIKMLSSKGFDVFIGSDHGHKETITIGTPRGTGIEVETKSKRTVILKDFGDYQKFIDDFKMIEYPKYYLPKEFNYLICEHNQSLGIGENEIISHGGISIEEVIVPFIKIEVV